MSYFEFAAPPWIASISGPVLPLDGGKYEERRQNWRRCAVHAFPDSGGVILATPTGTGNVPPGDGFVILAGGKEGVFYVIDPSNMVHSGADTQDPCGTYAIQLPRKCCNGLRDYGNRGSAAFGRAIPHSRKTCFMSRGVRTPTYAHIRWARNGGGAFSTQLSGYAPEPNPDSGGYIPYPVLPRSAPDAATPAVPVWTIESKIVLSYPSY